MKNLIKKVISVVLTHKMKIYLFKVLAFINKKTYSFMTNLSILIEGNQEHPKHRIMKYKEWFATNLDKNWIVIDIGCHNGHMTHFLSRYCKFIYGLELSKENINTAIKNYSTKNVEFIHADATLYDYSGKVINCVTLSNVLEHIENRKSFLEKIIANINWAHKPLLLIRVPMIDRDWMVLYHEQLGLDYRLDSTHFTEYTLKSFEEELEDCNIFIESYHVQWGEIYAKCSTRIDS